MELEERALVVGVERVELAQLLLGDLPDFLPPAQPEEGPAARQEQRGLQRLREGPGCPDLRDRVQDRGESRVREKIVDFEEEAAGVAPRPLVVDHETSGAGTRPPRCWFQSRIKER